MTAEAGHHPNRVYTDQEGDLHTNNASLFNDDEVDINAQLFDAASGVKVDTSAITGFTGDTDTAGADTYVETQDAGGTATAAKDGGLLDVKTGDGSVSTGAWAGGAGGAHSIISGAGGASTGTGVTGNDGGAGGAVVITGGDGGATADDGAGQVGGAGAAVAVTAGDGGAASAGTAAGGVGADLTLAAGAGGTSVGGVAGAPGDVVISTGVLRFGVQTIDMADAAVTLTLVPGTPTGTLLTGNILYVDANSAGTENLLLPPEGDCTGLFLVIENTGGESVIVQNDAGGAVVTLETANQAYCACDGTTWSGTVGVV